MADDIQELRRLIAELTERVYRLERLAGAEPIRRQERPEAVPTPTSVSPPQPPTPVPPALTPPPLFPDIPPRSEAASTRESESLESRIGSQWFNRVGIIAVLVGVSYFLKYAFDNNWIGAAGRVAIGLIAGIAVVIWSEQFRVRGHLVFSWSLKAVGIGTMYLSLWAGFQMYQLFSGTVALLAMVLVTAATATLAVTEDAQVLAAFALVGGFATPLLLSTGQNREVALFSYVALLDVATLALIAFRPWVRLLSGAFVGTLILYIGWYFEFYSQPQLATTITFATVFFAIFALAPLVALHRPAHSTREVSITLIVIPLTNAAVYFMEDYAMLEAVNRTALAWIAIALAAIYLLLSRTAQKRAVDEYSSRLLNLIYIALAVGFLTTAIPLKLETHWITIAWFLEAAVLMWISYRAPSTFLRLLATAALVLGVGRLLLFDNFHPAHLISNARFVTYMIAIGTLAWSAALTRKADLGDEHLAAAHRTGAAIAIVAINVLALVALNFEVHDYFARELAAAQRFLSNRTLPWSDYRQLIIARDFAYSAILMLYGAALMWVGFWRRSAFLRWQAMVLLAVTIVKVFVYDVSQLERGYRIVSFIALGVLLLAVSFIYQRDWLRLSGRRGAQGKAKGDSARV